LLVSPPFYRLYKNTYSSNRYPLSLGYLAGEIKKETNWDIMVYNSDFAVNSEAWHVSYLSGDGFVNYMKNLQDSTSPIWQEVGSTINKYKPTVVGIYCCASTFPSASIVARIAKSISQHIVVIVGGPHPTSAKRAILGDRNIDIVVKGEGEKTIVELLNTIDDGGSFDKIKGIVYRGGDQIVETANRELMEDLDLLSFPHENARELLKDYDKHPKSAFQNIFATRGCPYSCFFCGSSCVWGNRVRFRSVTNVINEIKSLQKIGLKKIEFADDTFGVNKEYTYQLCDSLIRDCPGIRWACETRANLVDDKVVARMKEAGCRSIYVGVESGSNEMLKKMRKGITVEEAVSAMEIIRKHGISLTAFFLIGLPWETEDTLNDTFNLMKKTKGLLVLSIFTPYPETEAFEYCKRYGLIDNNFDVALYNHQSPENFFCRNIPKEKFREYASKMAEYVDRHNNRQRLRSAFTLDTLHEVQNYGLKWSLKILISLIRSRESSAGR
jgi:anaerobic magnesium-protoporphyrin IX monomethyl ester cyclase